MEKCPVCLAENPLIPDGKWRHWNMDLARGPCHAIGQGSTQICAGLYDNAKVGHCRRGREGEKARPPLTWHWDRKIIPRYVLSVHTFAAGRSRAPWGNASGNWYGHWLWTASCTAGWELGGNRRRAASVRAPPCAPAAQSQTLGSGLGLGTIPVSRWGLCGPGDHGLEPVPRWTRQTGYPQDGGPGAGHHVAYVSIYNI